MNHLAKGITGKTRCGRRIRVAGTPNLTISSVEECECKRCRMWKPKTKTEKIVNALERANYTEFDPTSKYRKFGKDGAFYFVGKSGALRIGTTVGKSLSLTHKVDKVLAELSL